jgi:phosphohistidine phosphatase
MAAGKAGRRSAVSELYLLRHAKAAPPEEAAGDRERPLEQRGRRAAQAVAAWIAERRLSPELVLCSPALRTRQTLDLVAPAFARPPRIRIEEALYLATAPQLLARLRQLPETASSVMLVGHNPGLYELSHLLADATTGPLVARLAAFPTGALASYAITTAWPALDRRCARLVAVALPKDLARGLD